VTRAVVDVNVFVSALISPEGVAARPPAAIILHADRVAVNAPGA